MYGPSCHEIVIEESVLREVTSARLMGAAGFVDIRAPFPVCDSSELPFEFIATIKAVMLAPQSKL